MGVEFMSAILNKPRLLEPQEISEAKEMLNQIKQDKCDLHYIIGSNSNNKTQIPESLYSLIVEILKAYAQGNPVQVIPFHADLTTYEAASILGVSRPYLIKLLEQKKIPHFKVGSHRRIKYKDLIEYKEGFEKLRHKDLMQIAEQEYELYGLD